MLSGRYQEYNLINQLFRFNTDVAESYQNNVILMKNKVENIGGFRDISWIRGRRGKPLAFRISFNEPIFLMLSHPISRFSRLERYRIFNNERQMCFDLAIVPAYFVTLNLFTVIKLWNEGARRFFSPNAEPIPLTEDVFWQMMPSRRGAQYSSMNFLLKYGADPRPVPISMSEILENYFKYSFWSFPGKGFSCSAHFINDSNNIRTMLKIAKTIYGFEGVYDDTLLIGRNEIEIQRVFLLALQRDNSSYKFVPVSAVLTRDISRDIQDYQNRNFFINGVLAEFRRRGETRFNTLTVVAEYGVNSIELQMALIGQIVTHRFQESNSLSYVGSFSEIKQETEELLQLISQEVIFHMDPTIADAFTHRFEHAINFLYPLVVTDGDDVMFCHPFVLSSLSKVNLLSRIIVERTEPRLFNALKLLDKMPASTLLQLQTSKEAKYFRSKGIFEDLVIRVLRSAIDGIRLSKILKQCF